MEKKNLDHSEWITASKPTGGIAGNKNLRKKIAWAITGSGHFLEESLSICDQLESVDIFLSSAAEEVLPIYGYNLPSLRKKNKVFRDKTTSSVPVGMLYDNHYHTVVIAPATSNTVAKCAFGISDSLPTNMFAQAGKLGILTIIFACDTEPVVITKAPKEWVELKPRQIELNNVKRLEKFPFCKVVKSPKKLEAAILNRLKNLGIF